MNRWSACCCAPRDSGQRPADESLEEVFRFVSSRLAALPTVQPDQKDIVRACIDGAEALPDGYGAAEQLVAAILDEGVEDAMRAGAVRALAKMQTARRRFDPLSIFRSVLNELPSSPQARGFLVSLAQTAVRADMRAALPIMEELMPKLSTPDARNAQMVLHQVIEAAVEEGWMLFARHVIGPDGECWTLDTQSGSYRAGAPPWS